MATGYLTILLVLAAGMVFSVVTGKLTVAAAITGGVTGLLIFMGAGFTGVIMMAVFFLLGSFATSIKMEVKEARGFAEKNKGRRNAWQVLANAGVPGVLGLIAFVHPPYAAILTVMIAAAFASATADTLSSELGMIYGRNYYNIISFKQDTNGENGVVSIEGTLFGVAGSLIIAIIYCSQHGWNAVLPILIAGTIGNLADSLLGATLERKALLKNNMVNLLNTLIAALAALIISIVW